ncbi:fimbrial protein [Pseudomonas shahriarae]|uniref:fimbrial protein n=1 Tax=Pseudomonas shahriarae TaxID=2745512 RepID=UPI002360ED6C|nr:fimbrial protein [Pseudomonas shahriarae]MDD1135702.1 type 1 fimbrial protein [Pseudomonas shahriarae]
MFIRKTMLATAIIAMGSMSLAHAAAVQDQGHGKVTFKGSIIDAPCSISSESVDQTVELGQISTSALADSGKSKPQNFQFKLEGCVLGKEQSVSATFSGSKSIANEALLGITGTASGAGIAITDSSGILIKLGEKSSQRSIINGNNTMQFSAYLQGDKKDKDGKDAPIVPGEFTSVADFTLAYQ